MLLVGLLGCSINETRVELEGISIELPPDVKELKTDEVDDEGVKRMMSKLYETSFSKVTLSSVYDWKINSPDLIFKMMGDYFPSELVGEDNFKRQEIMIDGVKCLKYTGEGNLGIHLDLAEIRVANKEELIKFQRLICAEGSHWWEVWEFTKTGQLELNLDTVRIKSEA